LIALAGDGLERGSVSSRTPVALGQLLLLRLEPGNLRLEVRTPGAGGLGGLREGFRVADGLFEALLELRDLGIARGEALLEGGAGRLCVVTDREALFSFIEAPGDGIALSLQLDRTVACIGGLADRVCRLGTKAFRLGPGIGQLALE